MAESKIFDEESLQKLFRYACSLCINQDDAYDLLQYSIEKYLHNQSRIQGGEMSYVRTIIRNRFIDEYRRSQRFPEDTYDDEVAIDIDIATLEETVLGQVELEIVWKSFDPFEREILYYWAVEEMTAQEISTELDVPRGTVLSRIYRLRKKIESRSGDVSGNLTGDSRV